MKLSFRDLKQQKFTIDAEPSDTIGQVKEKIAAEKGWDASSQKLIYSGKILADANTVESYKIEEKGFIVCMVSKPKTAPAAKPASASTSAPTPATPAPSTSTPAAPPAPQHNAPTSRSVAANPPQTPTPAQPAAAAAPATEGAGFNDPSAMLMGSRNQAVITEMEQMGFPRDQIEAALRAAFFNPDRAVDYLLNGIPESVLAEQRPAQQQQGQTQQATQQQTATSPTQATTGTTGATRPSETPSAPAAPAAPAAGGADEVNLFEAAAQAGQGNRGGASAGPRAGGPGAGAGAGAGQAGMEMEFLRNNPQFRQLRQLVQQQPAMLEPILQQLAEGNPQLAQMISQNQEQFLQLLSEDLGEGGPMPPGTIAVTEAEAAAIGRLCDLGFNRNRVIQAYFACDKNEDLAANFLFDNDGMNDDDEEEGAA